MRYIGGLSPRVLLVAGQEGTGQLTAEQERQFAEEDLMLLVHKNGKAELEITPRSRRPLGVRTGVRVPGRRQGSRRPVLALLPLAR
jgi:hypothetical protein